MIKIEIWSDVVCPFCYIGKRHLEQALQSLPPETTIQIEWKSFQLDPDAPKSGMEGATQLTTYEYLAKKYEVSVDDARAMTAQVSKMAELSGLRLNLEKATPTSSEDAHRLLQFSKTLNLQNQFKERLFKAHFVEGQNISNPQTLETLANEIGMPLKETRRILDSDQFLDEVQKDSQEALNYGITGVPFFVFNRKYAISGAEPVTAFKKVFENLKSDQTPISN